MNRDREGWEALFAAVCDGRASDAEFARLDDLLKREAEARDEYLYYVDAHACLSEESVPSDGQALARLLQGAGRPAWKWPKHWMKGAAFLAAVLLLALLGGSIVLNRGGHDTADGDPFIAVITHADAALWEGSDASVMIGAGVEAGVLELCEGRVELELNSGVQLALEGQSRFELRSDHHGILELGRLAASVPPRGMGFQVDSPGLSVVDLGTEFGLHVCQRGISELHVYEGEVEATVESKSGRRTRQIVSGERTRRLNPDTGKLEAVAFEPAHFVEPPELIEGVTSVWGGVRALRRPPETVRRGTFQHNYILLFLEQARVELEDPLEVSLSEPGCFRVGFRGAAAREFRRMLEVGSRVDSYFLHFDAEATTSTQARGTIHFERPIVAVIAGGAQMASTDELLGSWCTEYDRPAATERELEWDEVVISSDRRHLTVDWRVGTAADQIRVLVESEE